MEDGRRPDFAAFLDAELDGLARFARVLAGDRQPAHDLLAEVLEKAHRQWWRVGRVEAPVAYLRRMIVNRYLSDRRRWSRRHVLLTVDGSPPDAPRPPEQTRVDDRSELHSLLAALPRQQRAAIVLRYYLDLPDAEIAAELGCTPGAVRTYISRGLAALRVTATEETS